MKLFHSENLLNGSAFQKLPRGTIKDIFIRFSGTAQAGKTVALTDLGTVRVNVRGTDRHNLTFEVLNGINNLKMGTAEFSSTTGGSFSAAFTLPFHAWWDQTNGEYFNIGDAFIELRFPLLDSTLIASGTVLLFAIEAPAVSTYTMSLYQRNIQVGGAGQVNQILEMQDISSLYFVENANVSNILVVSDNIERANGPQADLKSRSNMVNKVETGITTFEVQLNPYYEVRSGLNKETKITLSTSGATNYKMIVETFSNIPPSIVDDSLKYRSEKVPAVSSDIA